MMRASLRSVFLLLMVFACVGAAGAAPRVFALPSGKTVAGEVVFVGRDEVLVQGALVDEVFYLPLNQFTPAEQASLVQWGRAKMARWANVAVDVKSVRKVERSQRGGVKTLKNILQVTATIKNRSAQALKEVKVETRGVVTKREDTNANAKDEVSSSIPFGDIEPGGTVTLDVAEVPLKVKLEQSVSRSRGTLEVSKSESGQDLEIFRVSVYVGPELIWHQRVK
ncbi:hypothetical protein [Prosthecobacter dejongeii]|uniref:Uncharacterized protein n=1 Tax=Prosthecobacter dejongeii TaxID=48465 RepID=A0A7W7YJY7_9BACT|nr:hypothetical protein [Prosthecobacter dejongeii]MBB5037583.1 hypothetical protein [Prosthecobacter dejongeii]